MTSQKECAECNRVRAALGADALAESEGSPEGAILALRKELNAIRVELGFYNLTVSQRNKAWVELEHLRVELAKARAGQTDAGSDSVPHMVNETDAYIPPFGTVRKCLDCGCLVAGGPTRCNRCALNADESEVLRAGTHPLPYVQIGMVIREIGPDPRWWVVSGISSYGETIDPEVFTPAVLVATLKRHGAPSLKKETTCDVLRKKWILVQDFDPSEDDGAARQ